MIVENVTRELMIKSKDIEDQSSILTKEITVEEKLERSESIGYNPRHASIISSDNFANILQSVIPEYFKPKKFDASIEIKIAGIGISIFDTEGHENLYISFKGLIMSQTLEISTLTKKSCMISSTIIKIKHFQIDSMDQDPNLFPVILSPMIDQDKIAQQLTTKDENLEEEKKNNIKQNEDQKLENTGIYFFMFELELEKSSKIISSGKKISSMIKIENLEILLQKFEIKINQEVIKKLINLKDYSKAFDFNSNNEIPVDSEIFSHSPPVLPFDKSAVTRKIYFRFVKLGVMQMLITFKKSNSNEDNLIKTQLLFNLAKNLGGAFANLSRVPFNFKEILIINSFNTSVDFSKILGKNYTRQAIIQFYKIFGSIDVIGNPLALIDKLGTGVFEFFKEPATGLLGGPKAFAKGVEKGVKSLISGVIGGSFDSISKISGTLYNAVKNATGDQITEVASNENIGKNILVGIKEGALDVYKGITGIVSKPIRGGKERGTKGFFVGLFSGAAGLLTSPIKLVLKVGNIISSSIASTAFLLNKGKIQTFGRERFPRHIGAKKIIESYNNDFAQAQALLNSFEKYRKQRIIYFSEMNLEASDVVKIATNIIIVLTPESFLYVLNGELYKHLSIEDIKCIELHYYQKLYLLCIISQDNNFSIPSRTFSTLACIYNALGSFNTNIVQHHTFKFKRPKILYQEEKKL